MIIAELFTIAGLTYIITMSKILKPLREFFSKKVKFVGEILNCQLCTGVWMGLFIWSIPKDVLCPLFYISVGSLMSHTVFLILERLKIK